jgi:hypothetical protein
VTLVLHELRDALARANGRPVRVEVLARQVGADPATVAAMLRHDATRTLITGRASVGGPGASCESTCSAERSACRRCPLAPLAPRH